MSITSAGVCVACWHFSTLTLCFDHLVCRNITQDAATCNRVFIQRWCFIDWLDSLIVLHADCFRACCLCRHGVKTSTGTLRVWSWESWTREKSRSSSSRGRRFLAGSSISPVGRPWRSTAPMKRRERTRSQRGKTYCPPRSMRWGWGIVDRLGNLCLCVGTRS